VVGIAEQAAVRHASNVDATATHAGFPAGADRAALVPLTSIDIDHWRALAARAIEPNGYYLPDWELAVNQSAQGRTGASALAAFSEAAPSALTGLMPVVSLWRACKIPLPALVSAHPYGTLCTPLLDRAQAGEAARRLLRQARDAGARALVLRDMSLDGAAMKIIAEELQRQGLRPRVLGAYHRASLDATRDAETLLREALGAKKLKELRRQRHRLAAHGAVRFDVARAPGDIAAALETFLSLEAGGWKGQRGTALLQHEGDAAFIRRACTALATSGQCEIISLRAGETPVAAGIVLRHQDRAFFFKIGIDEGFAKYSPGVQLTLELTRHLCADPAIASADSTASAGHPMIDPIWRGRFAVGDVLIPLRKNDAMVELIHAALVAHRSGLDLARRGVHTIRSLRRGRRI
jgi:CelD/BcsL family acetyltransferase involved in cellulose biosynthesis